MIMFTLIFQILFLGMVVTCHILFGLHTSFFSRIVSAYQTLLQMMFGEYDYSTMYEANPTAAAIVFLTLRSSKKSIYECRTPVGHPAAFMTSLTKGRITWSKHL